MRGRSEVSILARHSLDVTCVVLGWLGLPGKAYDTDLGGVIDSSMFCTAALVSSRDVTSEGMPRCGLAMAIPKLLVAL